ncbi:hypothetical protein EVAR_10012_1 [Eumeta japonica]|uniref:Uncharacterized protein n=1 Tax=Eumeta variegata TaxID=151549 RepID=A0A4C1TR11_EUMVA|nr:hypothetical protein EVAR_10012_1 [Eumeta japonica]
MRCRSFRKDNDRRDRVNRRGTEDSEPPELSLTRRKPTAEAASSQENEHGEPPEYRWSPMPIDICDLKGVTSALLASWVEMEYLTGEGVDWSRRKGTNTEGSGLVVEGCGVMK